MSDEESEQKFKPSPSNMPQETPFSVGLLKIKEEQDVEQDVPSSSMYNLRNRNFLQEKKIKLEEEETKPLRKWLLNEKYRLLTAFRCHGFNAPLSILAAEVGTKTEDQIVTFLERLRWKEKNEIKKLFPTIGKTFRALKDPKQADFNKALSLVFEFIAEFEVHPKVSDGEPVDLKEVYTYLQHKLSEEEISDDQFDKHTLQFMKNYACEYEPKRRKLERLQAKVDSTLSQLKEKMEYLLDYS